MFSFQPEAPLNSTNNRIFYTQSVSTQSIIDFVEVDLSPSGLDKTTLDISKTYRMGLGFGETKKWRINYF